MWVKGLFTTSRTPPTNGAASAVTIASSPRANGRWVCEPRFRWNLLNRTLAM